MSEQRSRSAKATGTVYAARFVKLDSSNDGCALQCSSGDKPDGVSFRDTRRSPYIDTTGILALTNEPFSYYTQAGECWLKIGSGGCTPGARLKPDTDGAGVAATTDADYYGAVARTTANQGQMALVELVIGQQAS